jgi:hypothetical protein
MQDAPTQHNRSLGHWPLRTCRAVGHSATLVLLLFLVNPVLALERDEKRAERVTGDDDPILIPRSASPRLSLPNRWDVAEFDPETTGSTDGLARGGRATCEILAWFPERRSDRELQEHC